MKGAYSSENLQETARFVKEMPDKIKLAVDEGLGEAKKALGPSSGLVKVFVDAGGRSETGPSADGSGDEHGHGHAHAHAHGHGHGHAEHGHEHGHEHGEGCGHGHTDSGDGDGDGEGEGRGNGGGHGHGHSHDHGMKMGSRRLDAGWVELGRTRGSPPRSDCAPRASSRGSSTNAHGVDEPAHDPEPDFSSHYTAREVTQTDGSTFFRM